jgi:hypothetical protein
MTVTTLTALVVRLAVAAGCRQHMDVEGFIEDHTAAFVAPGCPVLARMSKEAATTYIRRWMEDMFGG